LRALQSAVVVIRPLAAARGYPTTVKPLMFACPLFRAFHESDKAAKLKGANFNSIGTSIVIVLKNLRSAHHYITVFGVLFVIVYCFTRGLFAGYRDELWQKNSV